MKHTKKVEELNAREERAEFWDSLMFPKPHAKPKQKAKPKKKNHEPTLTVREQVKKRDHNRCQICGREATSLHHILFRSQFPKRKSDVPNLVCLCTEHHTGKEGPHQSDRWRRYWEEWSAKRYPEYWAEVRKCQNHMI